MQGYSLISFSSTLVQPSIESGPQWPFFKLNSICVGGSVLSICTEFLTDKQRGVVDGAVSEWIPIISCVPQGSVLGPLLFILYTSEMFELVENRLFVYADDSIHTQFASQQTHQLLLSPVTGTWLGFRSGA